MNFLKIIMLSSCLLTSYATMTIFADGGTPPKETPKISDVATPSTIKEETKKLAINDEKASRSTTLSSLEKRVKELETQVKTTKISSQSILRSLARTSGRVGVLIAFFAYTNKVLNGTQDITNTNFSLADLHEYGQKGIATLRNSYASLKPRERATALSEQITSTIISLHQTATKKDDAQSTNSSTVAAVAQQDNTSIIPQNNNHSSISPEEVTDEETPQDAGTLKLPTILEIAKPGN